METKIKSLSQILSRLTIILMIFSGNGGHIGFLKMPEGKILHTLQNILI